MVRLGPNDPPLSVRETAEIGRMTALAALRGGTYTTAQKQRIDRIIDGARQRAEKAGKK